VHEARDSRLSALTVMMAPYCIRFLLRRNKHILSTFRDHLSILLGSFVQVIKIFCSTEPAFPDTAPRLPYALDDVVIMGVISKDGSLTTGSDVLILVYHIITRQVMLRFDMSRNRFLFIVLIMLFS
jgi:hypothetical protein